ncbi:MAG: hypothetical protein JSS07_10345 [Proteobacteria bacterium]|nr:hypothetical protein [Pseudomonadota bacterium]
MKKKVMGFGFLLLLLNVSYVHADQFLHHHWPENVWIDEWETNFLIAVFAGYGDREGNMNLSKQYGGFPLTPKMTIVRDVTDTGTVYGFVGGYQGKCQRWLLGGEINVESHHFGTTHPFAFSDPAGLLGWNGDISYQRDWMVGFTFRVGYYLVDYFLPYVRIGGETGRDKLITHLTSNLTTIPTLTLSEKEWVWRFLSGVGIEFPIYCTALTVRMEYQYHSKGKTIETNRLFTDGIVNPIANSDMQPHTQTGIIAIVRNFS